MDKTTDERPAFSAESIRESILYATAAMGEFIAAVRLSRQRLRR
jgi:hypothetical protein